MLIDGNGLDERFSKQDISLVILFIAIKKCMLNQRGIGIWDNRNYVQSCFNGNLVDC